MGQCDHPHVALATRSLNVEADISELIPTLDLFDFSIIVEMCYEEVFCVLKKIGTESGHRLSCIHHSDAELRTLFCELVIDACEIFVVGTEEIVCLFEVKEHRVLCELTRVLLAELAHLLPKNSPRNHLAVVLRDHLVGVRQVHQDGFPAIDI